MGEESLSKKKKRMIEDIYQVTLFRKLGRIPSSEEREKKGTKGKGGMLRQMCASSLYEAKAKVRMPFTIMRGGGGRKGEGP